MLPNPNDQTPQQLQTLYEEIQQLELQLETEKSPTALNDIRLRLKFLKWKRELLSIAYGEVKRGVKK